MARPASPTDPPPPLSRAPSVGGVGDGTHDQLIPRDTVPSSSGAAQQGRRHSSRHAALSTEAAAACHTRDGMPMFALDSSADEWQRHPTGTTCELCNVEFGSLHKHVTRRHCRCCGHVFCYLCTYDKAWLPERRSGDSCLPCFRRTPRMVEVHVCFKCYDLLPTPADALRRCKYCGQKVRQLVYPAHASVCEERYREITQMQLGAIPLTRRQSWNLNDVSSSGATVGQQVMNSTSRAQASANTSADAAVLSAGSSGTATEPPASVAQVSSSSSCVPTEGEAQELHVEAPSNMSGDAEQQLPDSLLCKICLSAEANTLLRPCGHAVACVYCVNKLHSCPMCRRGIDAVFRIYRS